MPCFCCKSCNILYCNYYPPDDCCLECHTGTSGSPTSQTLNGLAFLFQRRKTNDYDTDHPDSQAAHSPGPRRNSPQQHHHEAQGQQLSSIRRDQRHHLYLQREHRPIRPHRQPRAWKDRTQCLHVPRTLPHQLLPHAFNQRDQGPIRLQLGTASSPGHYSKAHQLPNLKEDHHDHRHPVWTRRNAST